MPGVRWRSLVLVIVLCLSAPARSQGDATQLDEAFEQAASYRNGESRLALSTIESAVLRSSGDRARCEEMEERLLGLLSRPDATTACRTFACRQLAVIGGDASVPALTALLADDELSHAARSALQVIPGQAATTALREASRLLDGDLRTGAATSLLLRSDDYWSWPLLTLDFSLATDEIAQARTLLWRGDRDAAAAKLRHVYEEEGVAARNGDSHLRFAALREWSLTEPDQTRDVILGLLDSDDPFWRGSAARLIEDSPGQIITEMYAARLGDLGPGAQARLIDALARTGHAVAAEPIAALAGSDDPAVRRAAIRALGDIGWAPHVPTLVAQAAAGDGDALAALERMRAEGVDQAIAACVVDASDDVLVVVARTLGVRRARRQRSVVAWMSGEEHPSSVRTASIIAQAQLLDTMKQIDQNDLLGVAMEAAGAPREKGWVLDDIRDRGGFRQLRLIDGWLEDRDIGREAARVGVGLAREAGAEERDKARRSIERIVAVYGDDPEIRSLAGDALSHLDRNVGFITEWAIAGPYVEEGTGGQGLFGVAFAPEPGGPEGEVSWKPVAADMIVDPGIVDIKKALGGDDRVAYLMTTIRAESALAARLEVGSDDGVKVWLNGEIVHANDVMRGLSAGQDTIAVSLRPGENVLLMKINQGGGDWRACCRVRDADGFPLKGSLFD